MNGSLVDAKKAALIEKEGRLLRALHVLLSQVEGDPTTREAVTQALADLNELFLLVVVGEFNAGKSAVINALLGEAVLPEGVTPTTAEIHLIRYAETPTRADASEGTVIITYPASWLRHIVIVDTPGTNAVIRRHQTITERFVPRSDLVLFVTSAERPFTESERIFLDRIRAWGKKIVFVLNKIDLLAPEEQEEVCRFVESNARQHLAITPQVFPVSARWAQHALQESGAERDRLWQASGFDALEAFIQGTLDQKERWRLKLSTPLGIARRALEEAGELIRARRALLREDVEALRHIEAQLRAYEEDMHHQFTYRLSKVDAILYEMGRRGDRFFDETLRLGRIFDLLNNERLKRQFEQQVIADTPQQVERQVSALIDWMVDQEFRQWQAVTGQVQERARQHVPPSWQPTQDEKGFEATRQALLDSIGVVARQVVVSYDKGAEVEALVQNVQNTLAQAALVEAGAVGLGAVLVAILHGVLLDVSGVLGAGVLAVAGLYLLPARREKERKELARRIDALRSRLRTELEKTFAQELERSQTRMRAALAPYSRFVRTEEEHLAAMARQTATLQAQVQELNEEVHQL